MIILSALVITIGSFAAAIKLQESAKENLWLARYAEARALRTSDQVGRSYQALKALGEANRIRSSPVLRDEAIAALAV